MTGATMKILLVEDNHADALFLQTILSSDHLNIFVLTHAASLSEAMAHLGREQFDSVLLNLSLPDSQGLATFEQVHLLTPNVPVVVYADQANEADAIQAVQAGAQDYLIKSPSGFTLAARVIRYAIERQMLQKALCASEEKFRTILACTPDIVFAVDRQMVIQFINRVPEGIPMESALGTSALDYVLPEYRAILESAIQQVFATGQPATYEIQARGVNDTVAWYSTRLMSLHQGTAHEQVLLITQDITEHKRTETELRQARDLFTHLFHSSPIATIFTSLPDRIFIDINDATEKLTGYARQDILGHTTTEFDTFANPDEYNQILHILAQEGRVSEFVCNIRSRSGFERMCSLYIETLTLHGKTYTLTQVVDVSEQKKTEQALREAERKYRMLVEQSPAVVYVAEGAKTWRYVSPQIERILGYPAEEYLADAELRRNSIHPDDLKHIHREMDQSLKTGARISLEHRMIARDGRQIWVRNEADIVYDPVSGQSLWYAVFYDITERKQAEEALRTSEEKFRGLIKSLDSVISIVDADGTFLYMNDVAAQLLGGTPDDFRGKTMYDLFPLPVAFQQLDTIRHVIREDRGMVSERQTVVHGSLRWFRTSIQPIHDETGCVIYALVNSTDIHDLKTMQQELLELNRTLEERVRQRTAEVQHLYEYAPTGYHSLDAKGNVIMVNQTELDWLGYTRDEMIGRPFTDFATAQSFKIFQKNFPVFKQRGWVRNLEFDLIRKDGSVFPVLISGTAVYDEHGTYVMSRSTVFDNTERKQAELALRESEVQNRLLFEESPDAVVLFDTIGRVVRMNRAFEIMTGYPTEQLVGHTLGELGILSNAQFEQLSVAVTQALRLDENLSTVEFKLTQARGDIRDVGVRGFGLNIRGIQYFLTAIRDITTEKQAAETLRLANAELARAARAKDEFLANMSHELRTPLSAILGFSESLLEQNRGPINERQQTALRNIESSGRHLLELINDILDLSKVEAGRLNLQIEPVRVADACQASLTLVKELATRKSLSLTCNLHEQVFTIEADLRRLKQMLVNLLSNAVKFTPAGGAVSLDVTADATAEMIRFAVQDTGIGIASEDLGRLFQPFSQLDSSLSRQHEGTGLGLALVRRLAELHGGSVMVESELGRGSRFTLALPYHPPGAVNGALAAKPPVTARSLSGPLSPVMISHAQPRPTLFGRCILLVEDNEKNILVIGDYLQTKGYQVVVARNGREALDQVVAAQPDAILMDIQMPEMDGLETIRRLRAMPDYIATPIIALTALAMPGDRERCLEAGASDYITRPTSLKKLVEMIERLVC